MKTDTWKKYLNGGDINRTLKISCIIPRNLFDKYIYQYNGKKFGQSALYFAGGSKRLSTKYRGGKCPYGFVSWFFNDSKSMKCMSRRRPEEWINMYNYNFSYNNQNNKLTFSCDIAWKYCVTLQDNQNLQPIWQKLNDTT